MVSVANWHEKSLFTKRVYYTLCSVYVLGCELLNSNSLPSMVLHIIVGNGMLQNFLGCLEFRDGVILEF